jgi:hypothetical protein
MAIMAMQAGKHVYIETFVIHLMKTRVLVAAQNKYVEKGSNWEPTAVKRTRYKL